MRLVFPLILGAALVAALPVSGPCSDKAALRAAIGKSMALLDAAQVVYDKKATCSSCHNQVAPMVAAQALRKKGLPINAAVFQRQVEMTAQVIHGRHDYSLGHGTQGGAHAVTSAMLTGLAEVNFPPDEDTDAAIVYLMSKQLASGAFAAEVVRLPHSEIPFEVTGQAARAIDAYAPPSMRKAADAAIARARAWVIATPASSSNDSLSRRLEALVQTKAPASEVAKGRTRLTAAQNADGGWSQRPNMASDAYATGASLVALHAAGVKPSDRVYQRGLDWLLKNQAADGSWYVKARALPIQPPIDAGFPYGQDQWISSWATSYAAEAMAYAL